MKRWLPVALVALSVFSMTLFFVEQSKQIHAASETSLIVYEHDTTTRYFGDIKKGGYETYTNPVYDTSDKVRVGSSDGSCIYANQSVYQCDWTVVLPSGKLVLSGADTINDVTTTYAIVGGTGLYSTAKGEALLNYLHTKQGYEFKYTFHLAQ